MKPKKSRTKSGDSELAKRWRCDERSIRRWKKKNAPFEDVAAMIGWLALQRSIPEGTLTLVLDEQRKVRSQITTNASQIPAGAPGAPNVLKRLEEAEERAYRALSAA